MKKDLLSELCDALAEVYTGAGVLEAEALLDKLIDRGFWVAPYGRHPFVRFETPVGSMMIRTTDVSTMMPVRVAPGEPPRVQLGLSNGKAFDVIGKWDAVIEAMGVAR